MDNIEADRCIEKLTKLIQKYSNNESLSESCRNMMISIYDNITRENACELYSKISKDVDIEFSIIKSNFNDQCLKFSGVLIASGIGLIGISALMNYIRGKNSGQYCFYTGCGISLLGVVMIFSIGH